MVTVTDSDFAGTLKDSFFRPKDFTFVCPTEVAAFGESSKEFEDRDVQLLGGSTESEFVDLAEEGLCQRATSIVDPNNIVRLDAVNHLAVRRSPQEVLWVQDALQTDGPGKERLQV